MMTSTSTTTTASGGGRSCSSTAEDRDPDYQGDNLDKVVYFSLAR